MLGPNGSMPGRDPGYDSRGNNPSRKLPGSRSQRHSGRSVSRDTFPSAAGPHVDLRLATGAGGLHEEPVEQAQVEDRVVVAEAHVQPRERAEQAGEGIAPV